MSDTQRFTKEDANSFLKSIVRRKSEIKHYGVRGMKWGVRKKRSSSSGGQDSPSKKNATKVPNTFKNSPHNRKMSDAEMRKKLERLRMEREYKQLTTPTKGTKAFLKDVMQDTGKMVVRDVAKRGANAALKIALEKAAKNATGPNKEFFEAMANVGGKKNKNNK